MAYLREEQEVFEIDFPVEAVWLGVPKAVRKLEGWKILEKNDTDHVAKIKTKGAFLSYGSTLYVMAKAVNEKTTRMTIKGETPVTTITAMADIGRTRDRLEQFIAELANIMNTKANVKKTDDESTV
jgi:hypothetical protein